MKAKKLKLILGIVLPIIGIIGMYLIISKSSLIYTYLNTVSAIIFIVIAIGGFYIYPLFLPINLLIEGIKNKIFHYKYLSITGIILSLTASCYQVLVFVKLLPTAIPAFVYIFLNKYFIWLPPSYTILLSIILLVQLNIRSTFNAMLKKIKEMVNKRDALN